MCLVSASLLAREHPTFLCMAKCLPGYMPSNHCIRSTHLSVEYSLPGTSHLLLALQGVLSPLRDSCIHALAATCTLPKLFLLRHLELLHCFGLLPPVHACSKCPKSFSCQHSFGTACKASCICSRQRMQAAGRKDCADIGEIGSSSSQSALLLK